MTYSDILDDPSNMTLRVCYVEDQFIHGYIIQNGNYDWSSNGMFRCGKVMPAQLDMPRDSGRSIVITNHTLFSGLLQEWKVLIKIASLPSKLKVRGNILRTTSCYAPEFKGGHHFQLGDQPLILLVTHNVKNSYHCTVRVWYQVIPCISTADSVLSLSHSIFCTCDFHQPRQLAVNFGSWKDNWRAMRYLSSGHYSVSIQPCVACHGPVTNLLIIVLTMYRDRDFLKLAIRSGT